MNEVINARIEEYGDDDWFTFGSLGPGQDGVLEIITQSDNDAVIDIDLYRQAPTGAMDICNYSAGLYLYSYFGSSNEMRITADLRNLTRSDITYFLQIEGSEFALGDYKLTIKNDIVLARLQAQEALENIGKIDSLVNSYPITSTLGYLTGKYDYVDQYGALGSHNPEEFFTRLFRNKYEQDPSRVQVLRGVEAMTSLDSNNTQLSFLSAFALDNDILGAGSYNYTNDLSIPNVPLDAAAFAETALVYSALIGQAPTQAEVARLTLTPEFEVRPLGERAKIIMEMPAYAARYGLAMPEVDFVGVSNGKEYVRWNPSPNPGGCVSLGADDLGGTLDDGSIYAVELFLNGELNTTRYLSDVNGTTGFYDFNLSSGIASGDYRLEVVAEDVNGPEVPCGRWISVRREDDANVTIRWSGNWYCFVCG